MDALQIVVDTNVVASGLRSSRGASYRLLELIGKCPAFEINISVPLVLEYEEVLKRQSRDLGLTLGDIDAVLDYFCRVGNRREIHYLWRSFLRDPGDDLVLEVAVESGSEYVVTFNARDFAGIGIFGIEAIPPREFLALIKELP